MAIELETIKSLIKESIPDADIAIEDTRGDGDHYAAIVSSNAFRGLSRVQQHQLVSVSYTHLTLPTILLV